MITKKKKKMGGTYIEDVRTKPKHKNGERGQRSKARLLCPNCGLVGLCVSKEAPVAPGAASSLKATGSSRQMGGRGGKKTI